MDQKIIQELSEVVQSANLNFLFGAGTSVPFLPLLGSVEQKLNAAKGIAERELQYKVYLNNVMLPNKKIVKGELKGDTNYIKTCQVYQDFIKAVTDVLIRRKSTILSKQVNLFTTNIDIIMERCLEELSVEYNDGFSGRFEPNFSLANFKKSIHQRSLHFEHITEIPVINLIKMHGSLTWALDEASSKITFSRSLDHIDDTLASKTGEDFQKLYQKIQVVNPEESKHLESVLNLYYSELLRLYSSELEKENAALFVIGFSMEDKHIREITLRAAKSNPTLRVFICCSKNSESAMKGKMDADKHPNIHILATTGDSEKFTLEYFCDQIVRKIILKN